MRTTCWIVALLCVTSVARADDVEVIPLEKLPESMIVHAQRMVKGEVVGARKQTRNGQTLIIVEIDEKAGPWEEYFTVDGQGLGGGRVAWRKKDSGEAARKLFETALFCAIPGGIGAFLARRAYQKASLKPTVNGEWFSAWAGATAGIMLTFCIVAQLMRWGTIFSWFKFFIMLGCAGGIVASVAESVLLGIESWRRGRKVARYVHVIMGVVGASLFGLMTVSEKVDERNAIERRRAIAFSSAAAREKEAPATNQGGK